MSGEADSVRATVVHGADLDSLIDRLQMVEPLERAKKAKPGAIKYESADDAPETTDSRERTKASPTTSDWAVWLG